MQGFSFLYYSESQDENRTTCEFHNPDFIICSSILSFYIPLIIIIFINVSIFKVCLRSQKDENWRARTFRSDILKLFLLVQMIHDRDKAKKTKMRIQNEAKNEYNRVRRRSAEAKRAILRVSTSLPAETEVKVRSQIISIFLRLILL